MSKRFIETELFEDEWFMQLTPYAKLLYVYLFTKCDHAGLIKLNIVLSEFQTGIKGIKEVIAEIGKERVIEIDKNYYFLPKFFKRQYPNYPKNAFRAATSAAEKLKKLGLWDEKNSKVRVKQELPKPSEKPAAKEPEPEDPPTEKIKHVLEAVDTWNFFADHYKLPRVQKLTDSRKTHIKARLKDKDFNLEQILRKVEKSDFLLGKKTDWKIDFDFIFSSKNNYVKIMEGKYDGRNKQSDYQDELNEILLDIEGDSSLRSRSE